MTRPSQRMTWQDAFVPAVWPTLGFRAAWRRGRRLVWPLLGILLGYALLSALTWAWRDTANATHSSQVKAQPTAGPEASEQEYVVVRDRGLALEERQAEWDRASREAGGSAAAVLGGRPEE